MSLSFVSSIVPENSAVVVSMCLVASSICEGMFVIDALKSTSDSVPPPARYMSYALVPFAPLEGLPESTPLIYQFSFSPIVIIGATPSSPSLPSATIPVSIAPTNQCLFNPIVGVIPSK